jgi:hypothetical protein
MVRPIALALAVLAAPAAKPPAPPAPERPPPKVDVTLTATTPSSGWAVKVTNSGTVPVRIVADARLLELEITPPNGGAKVRCTLPVDMVPASDMERGLVLVAGRSYTERFDPRLFCFGEREAAALVPGATVTARYGFGGRAPTAGPKAFVPLVPDASDATAPGPVKAVDVAPLTLPAAAPPPAAAAAPASADGVKLVLSAPPRLDLERTFERQITVSVKNAGPLAVRSIFTSATVGFDLVGPDGTVSSCGAAMGPTPIPELLQTLAPGSRADVGVGLILCPSEAFRKDGLYQVRPKLDTRRVGTSNLTLFRGEASGEPSLLRLHTSTTPRPPPTVDPP